MTPKLLLIRPNNDKFTSEFSFPASDLKQTAEDQGWTVKELKDNDTNRSSVETYITTEHPDLIIHYDHGAPDKLFGQDNNVKQPILDSGNVNFLSSTRVSTVSCESAKTLGPQADAAYGQTGDGAYLGYNLIFSVEYVYYDYFKRAANAANIALLEGKTFDYAKTKGYEQYNTEINNLLALPTKNKKKNLTKYYAVIAMLIDQAGLTLVGNGDVTAKP